VSSRGLPASLSPLADPAFRWYFLARLVAMSGTAMASVALAFAVLKITDSASALGQVLAAHTIPLLIFLLLGGVVADRLPRALVIQGSNISSALLQASAAVLVITGRAEIWMLVVIELLHGVTSAVGMPAMSSIVPQLVPRGDLQRANVLLSMTRAFVAIIGPSVAGILVVTAGPGWALAVDATTWAVAAAFMTRVRPASYTRAGSAPPNALRELREGWTVFRTTTWLWTVVVAFGILNAIHSGAIMTLGPPLAKQTFGEQGWGLALSAESAGVLLMTVLLLRVRFRHPLRAGMIAVAALGPPMLVLGGGLGLPWLLVAMAVGGAGTEVFVLGWNLAMQENIPEEMLARAYSYDSLGSFVAMPIGQLAYGPLGERFGYQPVLLTSGVVYIAVCLVTLGVRSVRNLPRAGRPESAPSGSPGP
jgi:MFS family permease